MTSTVRTSGRFCNHLIRNIFVSILAEKSNLVVDYSYHKQIEDLGINLFVGRMFYPVYVILNDQNFMNYVKTNTQLRVQYTLGENTYFQTKEGSNFLFNHFQTVLKSGIIDKNKFKDRYENNNDVFIHVRLGDVADKNPGFEYYNKVLSAIQFDKGYLSSDSPDHPICQQIIQTFPNITIIKFNEVETMMFGSTCKHVVLSHGSFSACIGYMSFFSNVFYPCYEKDKIWYGDMFSIDSWNCIH